MRALLCLACFATPAAAAPQWTTDAAANFPVGDAGSDQNQAKIVGTPDGGFWVSWFDGIGSGWDVRLQKLSAAGTEAFAHNGLLVADRSFSSTQDYGLDTDVNGDALLAFRDPRAGGTQIAAAKVTAAGAQPWGTLGVQLTSTTNFVASPKIAGTSDGGAVVAWTENSSAMLQKLDASGVPQWPLPVTLTPVTGSYTLSDLQDSGTDVIAAIVHQTGGFSSPRHLLAQKFDASGGPQWGAVPVGVFTSGSLQFGNFPTFLADGAGGAVFSWYSSSPSLQVFLQRLNGVGAAVHAANGLAVSNDASQIRVTPSLALDTANGDAYVFWREQNATQSQSGVSGQRIDGAGSLLWGPNGAVVVALSAVETGLVSTVQGGASGALVLWEEIPSFGSDRLYGAHLDAAGSIDAPRFDVSSTASGKARLVVAKEVLSGSFAVAAWSDARTDGGDIYVQRVNFDGTLGAPAHVSFCFGDGGDQLGCTDCPCANNAPQGAGGGCLNSNAGSTGAILVASGTPDVSGPNDTLHFDVLDANVSTFGILASGSVQLPNNPANVCFTQNPGSGVQSLLLDGLRCVGGVFLRHGSRASDANGDIGITTNGWGPPNNPLAGIGVSSGFVAGQTRHFQVFYREAVLAGCMTGQNTTQGVAVTFL